MRESHEPYTPCRKNLDHWVIQFVVPLEPIEI